MNPQKLGAAAALLVVLALPLTAFAGGKHGPNAPTAGCTVSATTSGARVSATGLPTDQVINFMVTTSVGTTGWVLGYTPDGTWNVDVEAPSGSTTYSFVSRVWGPGKYDTFASCSA
jgi:hypothetical protein